MLVGECLLPTSGLLATASAICLFTAIAFGFSLSSVSGFAVLLFILVVTPALIAALVKTWPRTKMGQKILNRYPGQLAKRVVHTTSRGTPLSQMINQTGIAETDLQPNGTALLAGENIDVVTEGQFIKAGQGVCVSHLEMGRLYVRPISPASEDANRLTESPRSLETPIEDFEES